jgi:Amt family ammonium transporter
MTGTTTGNGLFFGGGLSLLKAQLAGVIIVGAFVFLMSMVAWVIIRAVMGLRVSREEEMRGLDIGEHGNEAYSGFQVFSSM